MLRHRIPNRFLCHTFPERKFYNLGKAILIDDKLTNPRELEKVKNFGFTDIRDKDDIYKNLITKKRGRYEDTFNKRDWISPSNIKMALEEAFNFCVKELHPELMDSSESLQRYANKGIEYEAYVVKFLERFYPVYKVNYDRPELNNYKSVRESYEAIERGEKIIYQAILFDPKTKIWGAPDFLIRADIFCELFPNNVKNIEMFKNTENLFGNNFYVVVDVKLKGCKLLKNNLLNNEKATLLNKVQVYTYKKILDSIQGLAPFKSCFIFGSYTTLPDGKKIPGSLNLGEVVIDNKITSEFKRGVKIVREIKNKNNMKELLKRYRPKDEKDDERFGRAKREYGFIKKIELKFNRKNIKNVLDELKKYDVLLYCDFESINPLSSFPVEDFQKMLENNDSVRDKICQIGVLWEYTGKRRYKSYFSKSMDDDDIKCNLKKLITFIKRFKNVGIVTWGNYEKSNYKVLRERYDLPELNIIDLMGLLKKHKVFNGVSLSLKKLIPMLHEKYPDNFKNTYDGLTVVNGNDANLELFNYYKTGDERVKDTIEEYNKIDCEVMMDMVEWLKNEME